MKQMCIALLLVSLSACSDSYTEQMGVTPVASIELDAVADPQAPDEVVEDSNALVTDSMPDPEPDPLPVMVTAPQPLPVPVPQPVVIAQPQPEPEPEAVTITSYQSGNNEQIPDDLPSTPDTPVVLDAFKIYSSTQAMNAIRERNGLPSAGYNFSYLYEIQNYCPAQEIALCKAVTAFAYTTDEDYRLVVANHLPRLVDCENQAGPDYSSLDDCRYRLYQVTPVDLMANAAYWSPLVSEMSDAERHLWEASEEDYRQINQHHLEAVRCSTGTHLPASPAVSLWAKSFGTTAAYPLTAAVIDDVYKLTRTGNFVCDLTYGDRLNDLAARAI